jgi:hypothetical protein
MRHSSPNTSSPDFNSDHSLADLLRKALKDHPMGISEYELMQWLKEAGHKQYKNVMFSDRLSLFQSHFILFHALYRLKRQLWEENTASLDISPLKIILLPVNEATDTALDHQDPLMDYYLDIDNLKNTTDKDVAELLAQFWRTLNDNEKRRVALTELELEDPVSLAQIKQQHRRLVMKHHPDRGGDKEKLQTINAAMDLLKSLYSKQQSDKA